MSHINDRVRREHTLLRKTFGPLLTLALTLGFFVHLSPARPAEFYEGKTIRLIAGTTPGGGFDTYARTIARRLPAHIPGNPRIVVQNMPGGGFVIAANYLYRVAKPDGLTLGIMNSGVVMRQLLDSPGLEFDARGFRWLGAAEGATPVCAIMAYTGLKTLKDILNAKKPIIIGAAGTVTREMPLLLERFVGVKLKLVEGYQGTSRIRAAVQRREVDGFCQSWQSMSVTAKELLAGKGENRLIPFIVAGKSDDPRIKDLPRYVDYIKNKEDLATYKAWLAPYKFFRSFVVPPNMAQERSDMLSKAFKATLEDPELLAMAKKLKLSIQYIPGTEIDQSLTEIFSVTPKVKENLRSLVQ